MNIMSQETDPTFHLEVSYKLDVEADDGEIIAVEVVTWLSGKSVDAMLNDFKMNHPDMKDFNWKQLTPNPNGQPA